MEKYQLPQIQEGVGPLTAEGTEILRMRLQEAKKKLETIGLDFALDIWKVHHYRLWSDWAYTGFDNFCQVELGVNRAWAYKLRIIAHFILAKKITMEKVKEIGVKPAARWIAKFDSMKS